MLKIGDTGFGKRITGGEISPDGSEILLKSYRNVYYFKRQTGESIAQALSKTPIILPYKIELQGEAICWAPNGNAYYCLSEWKDKLAPHIYFYSRI